MMLLEFRLYSVKQSNDPWVMKWEQFGRKQLWPHEASSVAHIWSDWTKLRNETQSSVCTAHVLAKNQTKHLQNTLLKCYCHIKLLSRDADVLDKVTICPRFVGAVPKTGHMSWTNFFHRLYPCFVFFLF
jgi:hypothetical protein